MIKKSFNFFSRFFFVNFLFYLAFFLPNIGNSFLPTISFWQMGRFPIATVDSTGMGASLTNSLAARSVQVGGLAILNYKALVINSGTCTDPGVAASLVAEPVYSVVLPFSFTPTGIPNDQYFTVCVIGQNYGGAWQSASAPTASQTIRVNTIEPVVNTLTLNGGVDPTMFGTILTSFNATHSNLNVTEFCYKTRLTSGAPATPAAGDSCWKAVNAPSPGVAPSTNVSFANYFYTLGFTTARYYVFAWAKSANGAISVLSSAGNGTTGTDKNDIQFNQSLSPDMINVLSVNSDTPNSPVQKTDLVIAAGNTVYIKWNASDDDTLPANPITISYTTDDVSFTSVVSSIPNSAGAGCTVDGIVYTGCYRWLNASPTSSYYKVRVSVTDVTGLTTYSMAPPNNTSPFEVLAGNTESGLGSSAASAILTGKLDPTFGSSDSGNFVVTEDGKFYLNDLRGLMVIEPSDGLYKRIMSVTGVATDGLLGVATLHRVPTKIALDFNNGLLIYDYDKIRRFDFATNTVTTIIGGGNSKVDGVLASNFELTPATGSHFASILFVPLPNGDIWFNAGDEYRIIRNSGSKIRVYRASDGRVYEKIPTGTGSLEDAGFDPSTYGLYNFGIEFNPTTSVVTKVRTRSAIPTPGGRTNRSVSYDPNTMVTIGTHVPYLSYWSDDGTITTPSGEMYAIENYTSSPGDGLYKYNSGLNNWDRILGTATKGACVDGTPALSCNVDLTDAYVTAQGVVFFMDRGRIRTIDINGDVLTVFGQSMSFGDGELATTGRMNTPDWIDYDPTGKIVFLDHKEFKIREFTPGGNLALVAGNGNDGVPDTLSPANTQGILISTFSYTFPISIDQADSTIYYNRAGRIAKLDRGTGIWSDIVGGGPTWYASADGSLGNQVNISTYYSSAYGFNGTDILVPLMAWDGTQHIDSLTKTYNKTDGTQSHLIGVNGASSGDLYTCPSGTLASSCRSTYYAYLKAHWDAPNARWLLANSGNSIIRAVVPGGNMTDLVNLPRAIQSFTYIVKATVPYLYYCSSGSLYKYNLNTSSETQLNFPSPSISCGGQSLVWDPVRQSIIFPMSQNGLGAIAEFVDP